MLRRLLQGQLEALDAGGDPIGVSTRRERAAGGVRGGKLPARRPERRHVRQKQYPGRPMVDFAPQVAAQTEAAARPSIRRYYVLGLLTVVYALNFLDRTIFNVLIEPIKKDSAQ